MDYVDGLLVSVRDKMAEAGEGTEDEKTRTQRLKEVSLFPLSNCIIDGVNAPMSDIPETH